jgi:hypothetical protein
VAQHAGDHDVVLEQAHGQHRNPRSERHVPRLSQPNADRESADQQGANDTHDLHDAREAADEQPVREPDRPERDREQRRDERDQQQLAPDEHAQLEVDQIPRIAHQAALPPG